MTESLVDKWRHWAEPFVEARAARKVVHRAAAVARVGCRGVFVGGAIARASVCKGHVDATFSIDVKVVEIEQIPVRPADVATVP